MGDRKVNLLLSSFILSVSFSIFAQELPKWITDTSLGDSDTGYVVCSHESLDPEKAKILAEDKCLSSALKGLGVELDVKSKTVQSLTGADASESVETTSLRKTIKCDWQNQFIERNKDSYRVWLKCKYSKKPMVSTASILNHKEEPEEIKIKPKGAQSNSTVNVFTAPVADKILIKNAHSGERVIESPEQNMTIDLKAGDEQVILKKLSYKNYVIEVKDAKDGDVVVKSIIFEKDI